MGYIKCCVPNCCDTTSRRHRFPNAKKDQMRLKAWLEAINNSSLLCMTPEDIYNTKRVCHRHFEMQYYSEGATRLHINAIPTLHLPNFLLSEQNWEVFSTSYKHSQVVGASLVSQSSSSMENSRIPFPSRLKPPSSTSSLVTSNAKSTKILQPREFNEIHDDLAVRPPPARRLLSRRSKSFSDLRTATTKPIFDAVSKKKNLPSSSSSATKPLTKSTSISNLKTTTRFALKTIPEKVAKPVATHKPFTTTSTAKATKRTAPPAEDEVKPKVPKAAKPAPYDYKARFNLLSEKHTTLVQVHKEMKQKIVDSENDLRQYEILKNEHTELQRKYNDVYSANLNFEVENKHLLKESENHNELKQKFASLDQENVQNIKYINELEQGKSALQMELGALKVDHKTLSASHTTLQKEYNTSQNHNQFLMESKIQLENQLKSANETTETLQDKLQLYKTTIQENEDLRRIMHNQIQDLKGTIRVFCRVRPNRSDEEFRMLCNISYLDEETLEIKKCKESISCISGKPTDFKQEFCFDKVFPPQATQTEIFEELSQLVQSALDGYHICVFAYGQTGSGKTYTMQGENDDHCSGMIPRTIRLIFRLINKLKEFGWTYKVQASFLEIYNETVRDLLNPNNKEHLEIRFNEGKGTTVTNLTTRTVQSAMELQHLMFSANQNRAVAVTNFNEHSSRSHAVTKITLAGENAETKTIYLGSLSLVDLAGSESAKTSNSERIVETKNINKSLSTLGTVMAALHNKESHIPYRNSKLTYLLQSSLGGNSKTLMFVNIAPFEECYAESVNALRFAAKVKEVKIGSKRNKTYLKRELTNVSKP